MINKKNITINLDEISDSLDESTNFFIQNRLNLVELRTINKKNILNFSDKELDSLVKYLKNKNLRVSAIASPLFKWYLKESSNANVDSFYFPTKLSKDKKIYYIDRAIEIAKKLDTKIIRIFSNIQTGQLSVDDLINDDLFEYALFKASENDISLALENENICIVKSKSDIRKIIKKYKNLKIWFDVSNFYTNHERVDLKDLIEFKNKIVYFHLKDFVFKEDEVKEYRSYGDGYVAIGEGSINYKRLISDIKLTFDDGVFLSLETHVKENKISITQKSLNNLSNMLKNPRISYAIVGLGRVSQKHLNAINNNNNSELRGVYDMSRSKTLKIAKSNDAYPYISFDELINDDSIKVINLCTPHDTHISLAKRIVKKNKKVLCEKPFALSENKLRDALRDHDIKENVFIVMQYNFNSSVKYLYDLLKDDKLGKIKYFSLGIRWWRDEDYFSDWHGSKIRSGGSLHNQAIHLINILSHVSDIRIKKAYTVSKKIYTKSKVEDALLSIVELKNGTLGNIEIFLGSRYKNVDSTIFLSGEKGTIKIAGISFDEISHLSLTEISTVPVIEKNNEVYGNGHRKLINTLSNYLLGIRDEDTKLLTRSEDIGDTLKFIDKLYKANN